MLPKPISRITQSYILGAIAFSLLSFLIDWLKRDSANSVANADPGGMAILAFVLPIMSVLVLIVYLALVATPLLIICHRLKYYKSWQFILIFMVTTLVLRLLQSIFLYEKTVYEAAMPTNALIQMRVYSALPSLAGAVLAAWIVWAMCLKRNVTHQR